MNDPNNPTGYSEYNSESMNCLLKFLNTTKITLFLDEAYAESVKIEDRQMPKWRTISRYIMNNITAQSRIRAISSLSTTKNIAATGERLGAIATTPMAAGFADYARSCNTACHGNNNSLLMLNNSLETAQVAKNIKDQIEAELPKNASRSKIKLSIIKFIKAQIENTVAYNLNTQVNKQLHRTAGFEGSPLYLFLLGELLSLDKLDVLGLPDDFKYNDEPFFSYYQTKLVENLNSFRVNKNFRNESLVRLKMAKEIAARQIEHHAVQNVIEAIDSDGSYLFNFRIVDQPAYNDMLLFCGALAAHRGIATVPYPTGLIRFSLGGYVQSGKDGLKVLGAELEDAFSIFIKYWLQFAALRGAKENKTIESVSLLDRMFTPAKERDFIDAVIADYALSAVYKKAKTPSLQISDVRSLYHASPEKSGVTITTIGRSANSVFELHGDIIGS
ncbi:MAG: aminotransferase class I/II-fold pyridoxal phosphate-dependent enzyme, partial [Mucinivorans sp.]